MYIYVSSLTIYVCERTSIFQSSIYCDLFFICVFFILPSVRHNSYHSRTGFPKSLTPRGYLRNIRVVKKALSTSSRTLFGFLPTGFLSLSASINCNNRPSIYLHSYIYIFFFLSILLLIHLSIHPSIK